MPFGAKGFSGKTGLKTSTSVKNTTIIVSRKGALKEAKRDAGIPRAQHPESINRVEMRTAPHEGSRVIKDKNGKIIWTREYTFTNNKGEKIIIQDHSAGHEKGGQVHTLMLGRLITLEQEKFLAQKNIILLTNNLR
ncbi:HNH/endonuclease VII fold putative polymorphic toxin [Bacillus sp. 4A_MP3]